MDKVIKNKRGLELVTSHSSGYLCKPIHDIINYPASICSFESGERGKKEEKLQKFESLENKKSFLDEIKNIFHCF